MKKFSIIKKNTPVKLKVEPTKENFIKEDVEEKVEMSHVSKFISKIFETRQVAHIYHLSVNGGEGSNAEHLALQTYYEDIVDLIDDLVEMYVGQYGLIDKYDVINSDLEISSKSSIEYFEELAKFIKEERKCFDEEDAHLHNTVDDIISLVYKTIYRLKYLK